MFKIKGTAPLCVNRFSEKAQNDMRATQEAGSTAKKGRAREAKDFNQRCKDALHLSPEGWPGVPCSAFRNAMISACRTVGYAMTRAKLAVFIEADGIDASEGTPLVRIDGDWRMSVLPARNANKRFDLRPRPLFDKWGMDIRVRFDADMFTIEDVTNLLSRVGMQVGIGEGRADSKDSAGIGWGHFELVHE